MLKNNNKQHLHHHILMAGILLNYLKNYDIYCFINTVYDIYLYIYIDKLIDIFVKFSVKLMNGN